jgi:hypothetical protein
MLDGCLLGMAGTVPLRRRRPSAIPWRVGGTVVQTAVDARNVRLRRRLSYCDSGVTLKNYSWFSSNLGSTNSRASGSSRTSPAKGLSR